MIFTPLRNWLESTNRFTFGCYASLAAFGTYFCMYAFRKPFAAGEYADMELWGIDYKILLIISQVAGYALSKFIGIRVIAELSHHRRIVTLIGLILFAELALLGFGAVPYPFNFALLFLNGLPLGMVYGVVFSYLEGRQSTEALTAALIASFMLASGIVKAVGKFTIDTWQVPEFWMPATTGLLFLGPDAAVHLAPSACS